MSNPGIHSARSTNWKPALSVSKPNQRKRESRNSIPLVHSATLRTLAATTSASPRMNRMKAAPTSGNMIKSERMGSSNIACGLSHLSQDIPGDQPDDADQHGEGVVIEITG